MAAANLQNTNLEKSKTDWLSAVSTLVDNVDTWAKELGWATRRVEKRLEDSETGPYQSPALLLQAETCRLFLEPVARSVPFAEGCVDLYLMPYYNDIAQLYFSNGAWEL